MSVLMEFQLSASDFELGRILKVVGASSIELESLVPSGESTVPLFWVHNTSRDTFVESFRDHPSVTDASVVDSFEDRTLFSLDWDASQDHLFEAIREYDGQLLGAVGTADVWKFELRFSTHESLSGFTTHCENAGISLEVLRVYNPTKPDAWPWYGLTEPQRKAIRLGLEMGYYDIPRSCTTQELADELGVSDQAVIERLRRATATLVRNTLVVAQSELE
ncbi:MAG: helix-turn-helix domain-containing protein [Halovenus sp.]